MTTPNKSIGDWSTQMAASFIGQGETDFLTHKVNCVGLKHETLSLLG